MFSRMLHDAVRTRCSTDGVIAHVGGDEFIFLMATSEIADVCAEVLAMFDKQVALQYGAEERVRMLLRGRIVAANCMAYP
jgi:GGDEF domain-containing protein